MCLSLFAVFMFICFVRICLLCVRDYRYFCLYAFICLKNVFVFMLFIWRAGVCIVFY